MSIDAVEAAPCHSSSRLPASRIGGQHLNCGAASGSASAVEAQVVRAGLDGDGAGPRPSRRRAGRAPGRWTGAGRAPGRRSRAHRRGPAGSRSVSARRVARAGSRRRRGSGGAGAASSTPASSACTTISAAEAGDAGQRLRGSPSGRAAGTRRRREGDRKHLKPKTPASHSGSRSSRLPGTAPPQKPTSTASWPAGGRAAWRAGPRRVVVGGTELSGMSTSVVTPPSAAARVAVANPSHSVRPGSLTCTWVSTTPGSTIDACRARRSTSPGDRRWSTGATAAIRAVARAAASRGGRRRRRAHGRPTTASSCISEPRDRCPRGRGGRLPLAGSGRPGSGRRDGRRRRRPRRGCRGRTGPRSTRKWCLLGHADADLGDLGVPPPARPGPSRASSAGAPASARPRRWRAAGSRTAA